MNLEIRTASELAHITVLISLYAYLHVRAESRLAQGAWLI